MDALPEADRIRFWRGLQALDGTGVGYRDAWELVRGPAPGPTFGPSLTPLVEDHWQTDLDRRIDYLLRPLWPRRAVTARNKCLSHV